MSQFLPGAPPFHRNWDRRGGCDFCEWHSDTNAFFWVEEQTRYRWKKGDRPWMLFCGACEYNRLADSGWVGKTIFLD